MVDFHTATSNFLYRVKFFLPPCLSDIYVNVNLHYKVSCITALNILNSHFMCMLLRPFKILDAPVEIPHNWVWLESTVDLDVWPMIDWVFGLILGSCHIYIYMLYGVWESFTLINPKKNSYMLVNAYRPCASSHNHVRYPQHNFT